MSDVRAGFRASTDDEPPSGRRRWPQYMQNTASAVPFSAFRQLGQVVGMAGREDFGPSYYRAGRENYNPSGPTGYTHTYPTWVSARTSRRADAPDPHPVYRRPAAAVAAVHRAADRPAGARHARRHRHIPPALVPALPGRNAARPPAV